MDKIVIFLNSSVWLRFNRFIGKNGVIIFCITGMLVSFICGVMIFYGVCLLGCFCIVCLLLIVITIINTEKDANLMMLGIIAKSKNKSIYGKRHYTNYYKSDKSEEKDFMYHPVTVNKVMIVMETGEKQNAIVKTNVSHGPGITTGCKDLDGRGIQLVTEKTVITKITEENKYQLANFIGNKKDYKIFTNSKFVENVEEIMKLDVKSKTGCFEVEILTKGLFTNKEMAEEIRKITEPRKD